MVQVLDGITFERDENLLVGLEGMDDAGVYKISDDMALVQTLDFFPPVVDDPRQYGRIAAANALSDVYAMGGKPLTVLQIVGFPKDELPLEILGTILKGGAEVIRASGAQMLGGHSVVDQEIKYGLSVTGTVHPDKIMTNGGAQVGDAIYLTKPLGMGVLTTAGKKGKVDDAVMARAGEIMATLNSGAAEAMQEVGAHACTDITGFGLMGHAHEMAKGSGLTLRLEANALPVVPEARTLAAQGILSGGSERTRQFLDGQFRFGDGVAPSDQALFFDAETSGGLLVAVSDASAATFERALATRDVPVHRVGIAVTKEDVSLIVE